MSLRRILERVPYFEGLRKDALAEVARVARQHEVAEGTQVLAEGGDCEGLYVVVRGQVRLVKTSAEGRIHVLRVLGPGATFNDIAVFDGGPNSDTAVAASRSTVAFLPKAMILRLVDEHPEVARAALRLLSLRQRSLGYVVEDLALRDVTARVARLLLGCMGRQQHIVDHAYDACANITHQEIATMVGSVREVVQRALKQLEREGAIVIERSRIKVQDASKLETWAQVE